MASVLSSGYSSISGSAGPEDGNKKISFIANKISFVANDSDTYSMTISFDDPVGRSRDIRIGPGEVLSDFEIHCKEVYVQGVSGSVNYRILGVY